MHTSGTCKVCQAAALSAILLVQEFFLTAVRVGRVLFDQEQKLALTEQLASRVNFGLRDMEASLHSCCVASLCNAACMLLGFSIPCVDWAGDPCAWSA